MPLQNMWWRCGCHRTCSSSWVALWDTMSIAGRELAHLWTFRLKIETTIRQKSLLIGCGGGFLQECGQPYSPVSDWIKQVDIVLEDEGQQYGNMEEASTIARTPRMWNIVPACELQLITGIFALVVWLCSYASWWHLWASIFTPKPEVWTEAGFV